MKKNFLFLLAVISIGYSCRTADTHSDVKDRNGAIMAFHGDTFLVQDHQLIPTQTTQQQASPETSFGLVTTNEAYITACKNEGVPIPPLWPEKWTRKGQIPPDRIFGLVDKARFTTLWTYESPLGTCAALARDRNASSSSPVELLGIICSAKNSGTSCFWDDRNPKRPNYSAVVNRNSGYDITKDGLGAPHLDENCTDCHRGATPWIRIAGIPTEKLPAPKSARWKPLGPKGWENPRGPTVAGCSDCHAIPKLTPTYCAIAEVFIKKDIMPPKNSTGRAAMKTAMQAACQNI